MVGTSNQSDPGDLPLSLSSLIQVQNTAMRLIQFMCLGDVTTEDFAGPQPKKARFLGPHIRFIKETDLIYLYIYMCVGCCLYY